MKSSDMSKMKPRLVLVLGAGGQIALHVVRALQGNSAIRATLFLRDAGKLKGINTTGMTVMQGDVSDEAVLRKTVAGQDLIMASLAGEMDAHARHIVNAMKTEGVKRLVFVASLGIYDEVPGPFGKWNMEMIGEDLKTYRRAADIIEAAGLDTTIIRPAWLTDKNEVNYETTRRDEPFRGTEVSRKSVADYIVGLIKDPSQDIGGNIGLNKPNTDGDKPAFM